MSLRHTPGPWILGEPEYEPKAFRKILGGTYGMHNIGQVIKRQSRRYEDYANALLITAAPELLASLKEMLNRWHAGDPSMNPPVPEQTIREEVMRAKIAIHKAEGVRRMNEANF